MISEQAHFSSVDGKTVPVSIARPDGPGPFPTIMLGYELFGMTNVRGGASHMLELAARFADEGFVAAIPDYYAALGKQPVMKDGAISGGPSEDETLGVLQETLVWLGQQPYVDRRRVGAVGWCGGGRQVLLFAVHCPDIRAVASFYGRLTNRPGVASPSPIDAAGKLTCPVFGGYGEDDKYIPVDTARQFEQALERHAVPHEIHIYPGAGHAFMNNQLDSYVPAAADDAWKKLVGFFSRNLAAA